eukprot:156675_1
MQTLFASIDRGSDCTSSMSTPYNSQRKRHNVHMNKYGGQNKRTNRIRPQEMSFQVAYQKPRPKPKPKKKGVDPRDDYFDLKKIAKGRYSTVYEAKDKNGNYVAIKLVPFKYNDLVEMEIDVLQKCSENKYIINWLGNLIYTTKQKDKKKKEEKKKSYHWIILEYCSGGSIANRYIDEAEWPKIAVCVVEGLQFLHSKDIIHKDIKPSNILQHESGTYKIADFGLSENSKNPSRLRGGSLFFTAPEILNGDSFGIEADMWSFGVTMYNIVTNGKYPFQLNEKEDQKKLIEDIKGSDPKAMKQYGNFGRNIRMLVYKCLRKNVKKRYSATNLKEKHPWFQK